LIGGSPIAFPYMSCPERCAIDVYVPAASQHFGQRELAKFFTTTFHLAFSFVLIMTQCPASGASALIGYGGRCTARIVSEKTKKNIPIVIATNVLFKTTREWLVFPFLTSFYGNDGTKFSKKAERRLSLSSSSPARETILNT